MSGAITFEWSEALGRKKLQQGRPDYHFDARPDAQIPCGPFYPQSQSCNAISAFTPQSRTPMGTEHDSKGMGMTEETDRRAREREEIAARVANFKATQEKFKREREEYFFSTLESARQTENARRMLGGMPIWS
jgi:hypothetical protein